MVVVIYCFQSFSFMLQMWGFIPGAWKPDPPTHTHTHTHTAAPTFPHTLPELKMKRSCVPVSTVDLAVHLSWKIPRKEYSTSVPTSFFKVRLQSQPTLHEDDWKRCTFTNIWCCNKSTLRIIKFQCFFARTHEVCLCFLLGRNLCPHDERRKKKEVCWVKAEFRKISMSLSVNKSVGGIVFVSPAPSPPGP